MRLIPGNGPTRRRSWPDAKRSLFCLAPHGVFRAPPVARRAVGSYPAFSPLPPHPKMPGRSVFCDTFRCQTLSRPTPAYSTRRVVWWCSDFPLSDRASRRIRFCQRPSATRCAPTLAGIPPGARGRVFTQGLPTRDAPLSTCSEQSQRLLFFQRTAAPSLGCIGVCEPHSECPGRR